MLKNSAWTWEIAATTCSALFLSLIAILLIVFNGKPIFRWHGLTLNAVISLLSTSNKAALLFTIAECIGQWKWILFARNSRSLMDLERVDCASRGPLGSMILLGPFRNMSALRLGALLTILAMALDPFAQQLIQTRQGVAYTTHPRAKISRAQRYSKGTRVKISSVTLDYPATFARTDYAMGSAILYGLSQPHHAIVQQTPFECPSGRCEWDPFDSLAICSICNNVRDQLQFRDGDSIPLPIALDGPLNYGARCSSGSTFMLPNGLILNNENDVSSSRNLHAVYATAYSTCNVSETLTLKPHSNLFWSITILRMKPTTGNDSPWPDVPLEALECGLEFCVKRYKSQVDDGVLTEIETDLHLDRDPRSWQLLLKEYQDYAQEHWTQSMYDNLQYDKVLSNGPRSDVMFGDQFNVSQVGIDSTSVHFQDGFPALNISGGSCGNGTTEDLVLNGWCTSNDYSPSIMQVFNQTTSIEATFMSLARSMSNALRAGDDNGRTVSGLAGISITYYHIVWSWIILHAAILVGGFVFLGVTIYESQLLGIPAWKSSSLAQLSLHTEIGDLLAGVESVPLMEMKARQHFVQLFKNQ